MGAGITTRLIQNIAEWNGPLEGSKQEAAANLKEYLEDKRQEELDFLELFPDEEIPGDNLDDDDVQDESWSKTIFCLAASGFASSKLMRNASRSESNSKFLYFSGNWEIPMDQFSLLNYY